MHHINGIEYWSMSKTKKRHMHFNSMDGNGKRYEGSPFLATTVTMITITMNALYRSVVCVFSVVQQNNVSDLILKESCTSLGPWRTKWETKGVQSP